MEIYYNVDDPPKDSEEMEMHPEALATLQMFSWIMADEAAWHAMSWEGNSSYRLEEIVKILETMLDYQLYQLAFVLMGKLKWDGEIGEVFACTLAEWVKNLDETQGPLTMCLDEIKKVMEQKGLQNKKFDI